MKLKSYVLYAVVLMCLWTVGAQAAAPEITAQCDGENFELFVTVRPAESAYMDISVYVTEKDVNYTSIPSGNLTNVIFALAKLEKIGADYCANIKLPSYMQPEIGRASCRERV